VTAAHTFGQTLGKALRARGLTQLAFAERIGSPVSSVNAWINGNEEPRLGTLLRIARGLDTSVAKLLTGCRAPEIQHPRRSRRAKAA
jgi:transcriptional regulator with XRE-family HTH domain